MTMHAAQKDFLEERFAVKKWRGRSDSGRRLVKEFHLAGSEIKGWKLLQVKETEEGKNKVMRSIWSRGGNADELLSIDVFVAPTLKGAHETVLEVLGNMQSGAITRKTEKNVPGDVAFGLANTMITFARANLVVIIRNAGITLMPVGNIARDLDLQIQRRLDVD
jgi:hypothetical protein